jgi:hypothetical protein
MEKEQKCIRISVTFSGKSSWFAIKNDQITFADLKKLIHQQLIASGSHLAGDFIIADTDHTQLDSDPTEPIRTFLDDKSKVVLLPANDPIQGLPTPDPAASSTSAQTSKPTQNAVNPSSQPRLPQPMPPPKPTTILSAEDEKQILPTPLGASLKPGAKEQQQDPHEERKVVIKGENSYFATLSPLQRAQLEHCISFYSNACRSNDKREEPASDSHRGHNRKW